MSTDSPDTNEDEPTAPRQRLPRKEQVTIPVDTNEMSAAARASVTVPDPAEPVPPRAAPAANVVLTPTDPLTARVSVAGSAETVTLPIHNATRSGVALEIPDDSKLLADVGTNVNVQITLGDEAVKVLARVAHRRRSDAARPGGIGLRWDDAASDTTEKVERILAWMGGRATADDA